MYHTYTILPEWFVEESKTEEDCGKIGFGFADAPTVTRINTSSQVWRLTSDRSKASNNLCTLITA
jgi:hypothetical protein